MILDKPMKIMVSFTIITIVLLVKGAWRFIATPWLSLIFGIIASALLIYMFWDLEEYIEENYLSRLPDGRKIEECDKVRN